MAKPLNVVAVPMKDSMTMIAETESRSPLVEAQATAP